MFTSWSGCSRDLDLLIFIKLFLNVLSYVNYTHCVFHSLEGSVVTVTSAGAVAAVVRKIAIVRTSHLVQVAAAVTVNQVNHLYIMCTVTQIL